MENKKTKIAIIIVAILIITLIVVSYFYINFNTTQMNKLTGEVNKILESDFSETNIDFDAKTERNYAKVENSIKEYISKLKNIYVEMQEMVSGINPNSIFSAQNIQDNKLDKIDDLIQDYKEKSQDLITEYAELIEEEQIREKIYEENISIRKDYYTSLYNEIMLSEIMKNHYLKLDEEIKNEKGKLYDKLNKIEKMKTFLEENENLWTIKDDKIQFTNLNKMTQYYSLLNQIVD